MQAARPVAPFHFTGGALCLDYVNTRSWRPSAAPCERLRAYPVLVTWARQVGLLSEGQARGLRRAARLDPDRAARVLRAAVRARETIHAVFAAIAAGQSPSPRALRALLALGPRAARTSVVREDGRLRWRWPVGEGLDDLLGPVIWSALTLLTSDAARDVRACAAPNCRWLFLDRTRNRSRRWCTMLVCGNRAKVRRHHARRRAGAAAGGRA